MTYDFEALTGGTLEFPTEFRAGARYFAPMDCIIYLKEDLSYRAARLSPSLTVLLHPQEERAIGVKIKGVAFLVERLAAIIKAAGHEMTDHQKVNLLSLFELAVTETSLGEQILRDAEVARHRVLAERARDLIKTLPRIDIEELPLAA